MGTSSISFPTYEGLLNNHQRVFSDLPSDFETLGLLQKVPQFYLTGKGSVSHNFSHLTVQEFLAAFHIVHQATSEKVKVFKGKEVESQRYAMFVAGLNGLKHG